MAKKSSALSFYVGALLLLSLLMGLVIPTQVVQAATITVCASGCDYTTVQDAINGASEGDTINIAAETFNVDSTITVNKSVALLGADGGGAVLQGTNSAAVSILEITSSNVTIQNLTITHAALTPGLPNPWSELSNSLVRIPSGTGLSGIVITGNTIYVPAQSGAMGTWNGVAIATNSNTVTGLNISDNTIYNTRNGIVTQYNNSVTISGNTIYNTKGGIMNYTGSQADADNRVMGNNSWTSAHNEWDIVWNSGGGPYQPDYSQSVLALSDANNDAYVLSLMTTGNLSLLTGNRSHVFVNATTGTTSVHPANGNQNKPYATIQLGLDAVVPGGDVYVAAGTYTEQLTITKGLHLVGAGSGSSIVAAPATLPASDQATSSIVLISGSGVDAELTGFTITGPGPTGCGSIRTGIYVYDGANANIHHNTIQDVRDSTFSGCQNGVAIAVGRQYWSTIGTATIDNNVIVGYQKGGIVVDNTGSNANITNNTVTGVGTTSVIAQNGIQISRGATATLSGNAVTGNSFHLDGNAWDWGSTGILYYQSDAVTMAGGNTVSGNDQNLYIDSTTAATFGSESIGPSSAPLDWGYDVINLTTLDFDLTDAAFPGSSTNAEIEARVWHKVDDAALGLVTWTNPDPILMLTVEVKDSQGNPIQNAKILYDNGSNNIAWYTFGTTDAEGKVSSTLLTVGKTYNFYAETNASRSLRQGVVFDGDDTVTFQTAAVKVKVETCPGVALSGATVTYGTVNGFRVFGTTGSDGLASKELFPGYDQTFYADYNHTSSARQTVTLADQTDPLVTFKTTAVSLYHSGQILHGGVNGWYAFTKPTMEMFAGTRTFRIGGITVPIEVSGCSMSKAVNFLKLKDHSGLPLAGGTARGGYGSNFAGWFVAGATDASGLLIDLRDVSGVPTTMSYEMVYNGTGQVKTQDVSTNPVFEFQTSLVNMRLQTCNGTGLANGAVRFGNGSTYTTAWFPGGATNANGDTSAEFFPGTYSFEMQYQGTGESKLNIALPAASPVVWNTTQVNLQYAGEISYGGAVGQSAWFTKPSMNLLPGGPYKFHFQNPEGGLLDLSWSGCNYTASVATVKLINSAGAGISGATAKYYDGSWKNIPGTTDANGLLPVALPGLKGNVTFAIYYAGASIQKTQNIATNSVVTFQTTKVTVQLKNSAGDLFGDGDLVRYYTGNWYDLGTTTAGEVSKELLPTTYYFNINHAFATQQKQQNVGSNATVVFQTAKVTVQLKDSAGNLFGDGDLVRYYTGNWHDLGTTTAGEASMELLPITYYFDINHAFATQQKQQNTGSNATVVFQTAKVKVQLKDSDGNLFGDGDLVRYYTGTWHDLGTTTAGEASMELLPITYYFNIKHASATTQKEQNTGSNATVVFQTGKVHSGTATCTHYYTGSWNAFTQDMELLPGSYPFKFTGFPQTNYTIIAGSTNNIH